MSATPDQIIRAHQAALGRVGGASRSPAKIAAGQRNIRVALAAKKARLAREIVEQYAPPVLPVAQPEDDISVV